MRQIIFGIKYLADYWIFRNRKPLICGLVLHNRCNLRCRHSTIVDRPAATMRFEEAVQVVDSFYAEGGRCLYLEGGEPFIWKDKTYVMEDIVAHAKKRGYLAVIIYTNGTHPLASCADTIFVSVDGLQSTHDSLRGKSFYAIMANIRNSSHPSIYINYTINTLNKDDVADFCEYTDTIPQINGTFFYFHTPYYGYDDLFLNTEVKNEVLSRLLKLKARYKILNSASGLKSAFRNDWQKNLDICRIYEDGKYYSCCRENNDGAVCKECGYLSYAEIDQTLKLKPGAIINALKYF
ncbi:MAG: radical SAM protein [Bacteroidales bacterium]|nr:radical SAM protein [Bacteroidales bacterium]